MHILIHSNVVLLFQKCGGQRPVTGLKHICVVSDASGVTGERVVRATLAQFSDVNVTLEVLPKITTREQLKQAVNATRKCKGLIAYTLVSQTLRNEIALLANEAGVPTVDLIGPLMTSLIEFLSTTPAYQAGLYRGPSDQQLKQLEAMTFTVHHDDGQGLRELNRADIVIVGPSRTSKTPLSVYLAHTRGLKVANVPLVLGVPPFEELEAVDSRRVIALTISVELLARIRRGRQDHLGIDTIDYAHPATVRRELRYCHELYRQHPAWTVIDITGRSIEELAVDICASTVDDPRK